MREPIARRLAALLYTASERAQAIANETLAPLGLRVREWALLTLVAEHGPMSQQEAAEAVGVDRTSMVTLVDGLEERGWIARERNPSDRRAYALRLTTAGRRIQKRAADALDDTSEEFFSGLTAQERLSLRELLLKLVSPGVVASHLAE